MMSMQVLGRPISERQHAFVATFCLQMMQLRGAVYAVLALVAGRSSWHVTPSVLLP